MAYVPVEAMEVRLWGRTIGAVALDPGSRYYAFQYSARYISRDAIEPAPIAMPLARGTVPHVFPLLSEQTYYRLPAMLADALPDRFGNALIDAWMGTNGVTAASITPLDRLAYMGSRGMGALTFRPNRGPAVRKNGNPPANPKTAEVEFSKKEVLREEVEIYRQPNHGCLETC